MQRTTDYSIAQQPSQQNPHASASHQNTRVSYGPKDLESVRARHGVPKTQSQSLCRSLLTLALQTKKINVNATSLSVV